MIKPTHLSKGDTVAIVSLSAGTLGEPWAIHKLYIAKERLEKDYGLKVVVMPNALKGRDYLYNHLEERAADLMAAFRDKSIKAICGYPFSSARESPRIWDIMPDRMKP